jgi:hypothetical protein
VVGAGPQRPDPLQDFFDALGDRRDSIRAVSIDMNGGYEKAIRAALPAAEVCFDPFHVVALAGRAVDDVRRAEWNAHAKSTTPKGQWLKGVRWALRKNPEHLSDRQRLALATVQQTNKRLYRAYLLKEQLRALYHLDDPAAAPEHLHAWLTWAARSRLRPFVKLARTLRARRDGILAAIRLGLTNSRLEGLHSKVRLLSHRSFCLSVQPSVCQGRSGRIWVVCSRSPRGRGWHFLFPSVGGFVRAGAHAYLGPRPGRRRDRRHDGDGVVIPLGKGVAAARSFRAVHAELRGGSRMGGAGRGASVTGGVARTGWRGVMRWVPGPPRRARAGCGSCA